MKVVRDFTSPQSIPTGFATTVITWAVTVFDTDGFWSAGQPTRLTAQFDGIYLVTGSGAFVANAVGDRHSSILQNAVAVNAVVATPAPAAFAWAGSMATVVSLVIGDYIELYVAQSSGGNLNTTDLFLSMEYLGT